MKLYIYGQSCVLAGQSVPARTLETYDGDIDEAGDWCMFEGTGEELLAYARSEIEDAKTAGAGNDRYHRRVARSIMEELIMDDDDIDRELNGPPEEEEDAEVPTPMTTKHAPGPWSVDDSPAQFIDICGPYGPGYVEICRISRRDGDAADADFIVRACNSHDALLAACEVALSIIEAGQAKFGLGCIEATGMSHMAYCQGMTELRAAIARATGQEPTA